MSSNFMGRQQLNLLPKRLQYAQETNARKEIMDTIAKKQSNEPLHIMLIGAGGSFPAALFAMFKLRESYDTQYVEAYTPQTALRMLMQFDNSNENYKPKYDLIIGISYSGKTNDIIKIANICVKRNYNFLLLTGENKNLIYDLYPKSDLIKIVSYYNENDKTGKEQSMISMASTLIPSFILDTEPFGVWQEQTNLALLNKAESLVKKLDIYKIAISIKQTPLIHVFYEMDTFSIAADIESKFIESGVSNVVLHEKKNFSHGRTTALYTQDFGTIINIISPITLENKYNYDLLLNRYLHDLCIRTNRPYLQLGGHFLTWPSQNILEILSIIPYFLVAIGEELNVDIAKPITPYPKETLELYNYKGDF